MHTAHVPIVAVGVTFGGTHGNGGDLAFDPDRARGVRDRIAGDHPDLECVVVATCNRTELLLAGERLDARRALAVWHEALGIRVDGHPAPCLAPGVQPFVHCGEEAAEHLFRVACGLESAILGDSEIVGQLRRAWRDADAAGASRAALRALFRDAFAVGRQARARTDISAGGAGVGSAVATAVAGRPGTVLVIGAGDAGRAIARRISKTSTRTVTIVNRTRSVAESLASEIGGRTVDLMELDAALVQSDVVVCAVATATPLLTSTRLEALRERRPDWLPLIVDAGAPPCVEPTAGFDVVGLDTLASRFDAVSSARSAAVAEVERLVDRALHRRARSCRSHPPVPQLTRGFPACAP